MRECLITTKGLSREEIVEVLDRASEIEMDPMAYSKSHSGKIIGLLFYEPSTRTRMSFETAIKRLGGDTVNMGTLETSSVAKGESLADTIRVVAGYVDAIVLRHPKEGAAKMASDFIDIPLINAGDGAGQHPSQTLLDLYTIRKSSGKLDGLNIGVMGDLKYGRTVHSLAHAITKFDSQLSFISPEGLRLPENVKYDLESSGSEVKEYTELKDILGTLDILYVTRIQRERFPDEDEYRKVSGQYRINKKILENAPKHLKVMHPLPRMDEISPEIDTTDHAIYIEQAHNGVVVRMALLDLMLKS
jgi:aspartate carbamoyltransferase catalytic subunit